MLYYCVTCVQRGKIGPDPGDNEVGSLSVRVPSPY